MKMKDFSKKYGLDKRTIDYWTNLGLINPSAEKNGYREFDARNEEEVRLCIIMQAAGLKMDIPHQEFLREMPDDLKDFIAGKILENKKKSDVLFENALKYLT